MTGRQAYPILNITELLEKLKRGKYFGSVDFGNEYYHVELEEDSKEKV